MENLKAKLKKDAEVLNRQEGTVLPEEALITHAVKQAEVNEVYKEKLESENFAVYLLYMCEWFLKEIVESEMTDISAFVSAEAAYRALDEWTLASEDARSSLLAVFEKVKHPHPYCETRHPFLEKDFFTKKRLDNIVEDFKEIPIMKMLINKYYREPAPAATTKKTTATAKKTVKKKTQPEQLSLDMFEQLMANNETKKEENKDTDKVEETEVNEESVQEQSQEDTSKECYRYYSLHRPLGPGAIPQTEEKALQVVNFDECKKVEGTNVSAWGYVEYANPLSDKFASDYELTLLPVAASETDSQERPEPNVVNTVEQIKEADIEVTEKTEEKEQVIPVSESEETSEKPKQIDLFSLF